MTDETSKMSAEEAAGRAMVARTSFDKEQILRAAFGEEEKVA